MSIKKETVISLKDARKEFPLPPNIHAIYRWASHGVAGDRLETFKQGGKMLTSKEAVARFLDSQNQTPSERADAELLADGC